MVQVGTTALALVLSRMLTGDDYPGRIEALRWRPAVVRARPAGNGCGRSSGPGSRARWHSMAWRASRTQWRPARLSWRWWTCGGWPCRTAARGTASSPGCTARTPRRRCSASTTGTAARCCQLPAARFQLIAIDSQLRSVCSRLIVVRCQLPAARFVCRRLIVVCSRLPAPSCQPIAVRSQPPAAGCPSLPISLAEASSLAGARIAHARHPGRGPRGPRGRRRPRHREPGDPRDRPCAHDRYCQPGFDARGSGRHRERQAERPHARSPSNCRRAGTRSNSRPETAAGC